MVSTTFVGCALLGAATVGYLRTRPTAKMRRSLHEVFDIAGVETEDHRGNKLQPMIRQLSTELYGFRTVVELPTGYAIEKFRKALPVIEEATASSIRLKHLEGRQIELLLGRIPITETMLYTPNLIQLGKPTIPYHTRFGVKHLDFWDETCCHLVIAGATRMGKTAFLRLLFTNILLAMEGHVQFFYINNKIEDYVPFKGIQQIPEPAETVEDALRVLYGVREVIQERKAALRAYGDAVNVMELRKIHPDADMPPIFVVFDEFGRFADDDNKLSKELQKIVLEIAETAGYLDVHLVIATQRPDATTVLKPRIRANIVTRVCFQTADEKNSEIVIHTGQAAHLDSIQGRAVVLDGTPVICQMPYIASDAPRELLRRYRSEFFVEQARSTDPAISETFPGTDTGPHRITGVPGSETALRDRESNHETIGPGRPHSDHSASKGRVLHLHAKSRAHTHRKFKVTPLPSDSGFLSEDRQTEDL